MSSIADEAELFSYNAAAAITLISSQNGYLWRCLMNKSWVLTQESFDALLDWLDPHREQAGQKYEDIRRRLIKLFVCRGCPEPEDLADETINRVIKKLKEIESGFTGDKARYFYGVAN